MTGHQQLATALFLVNHHIWNRHTVRNGLDLGSRTDGLVGSQTTLGIDQVRGEDGVNQSRLSQTSLACFITKMDGQSNCPVPTHLVFILKEGTEGDHGPYLTYQHTSR